MSSGEIANRPEIALFDLTPAVEQARQLVPPAQARVQARSQVVLKPFWIAHSLFCLYYLGKWLLEGDYLIGLLLAALLWFTTCWIGNALARLYASREHRELKQAQDNVGIVLRKACTDFLAEQDLGHYRWIARGQDMLGLFPDTRMIYLYSAETGHRHGLIDAARVVRQVRVGERTQTVHTSHTHTTHSSRRVSSGYYGHGEIGPGTSNSVTETVSSTHHTFTLQIQLQEGNQNPTWSTWGFGSNWEEAENWRLQIAQAAGLQAGGR